MKLRMSGLLSLFDEEKKKSFFIHISFFPFFFLFFSRSGHGNGEICYQKKKNGRQFRKIFPKKEEKQEEKRRFQDPSLTFCIFFRWLNFWLTN